MHDPTSLITAKAEARSNLILKYSMTPSVLQFPALERWNGRLPVMNGGGAMPMLTFDVDKLGKGGDDDEKKLLELLGQEEEMEKREAEAKEAKDAQKDAKAPAPPVVPAPATPDPVMEKR